MINKLCFVGRQDRLPRFFCFASTHDVCRWSRSDDNNAKDSNKSNKNGNCKLNSGNIVIKKRCLGETDTESADSDWQTLIFSRCL